MHPEVSNVAARFLRAKTWDDPAKLLWNYKKYLETFQVLVEEQRDRGAPNKLLLYKLGLAPFAAVGANLAGWILQTRQIPPGQEKSIELAARAFSLLRRAPPNVIVWHDRNKNWFPYLLEAAQWPERSGEVEGQVVSVGPFKVHNTIGADADQFKEIQSLVTRAVSILETTSDFRKVLYGDVYIVGQIRQSKTIAWYSPGDDDVYLRSMAKRGIDDLQSLLHELGHRYWFRFASTSVKQACTRLYSRLKSLSGVDVELPKVGDPVPIPVRGAKTVPIVEKYQGDRIQISGGGWIGVRALLEAMRREKIVGKFPTLYSMKDVDEFFAECFAFFALKKLSPELAEKFELSLSGL